MLKHHCSTLFVSPNAETPLFNTFYSSHSQNTPVFHFLTILIDETTPSSNCFAFPLLLLKHHCQQLFTIFPDAETPLDSPLFDFLPMLKHHRSTLLTFFRC
jgi:hypothetical protein